MVVLISRNNPTKGILIALNDDDDKVLQFLFDSHIVFGMYQLTHTKDMASDHPNYGQYQTLMTKFPNCKSVAHLNINSNYIPRE